MVCSSTFYCTLFATLSLSLTSLLLSIYETEGFFLAMTQECHTP